jgi:hypothetical protein
VTDKGDRYLIRNKNAYLEIPKSYVLKTNNQKFHDKKPWINFYLDPDFFKKPGVFKKMLRFKSSKSLFIYGRKLFRINWDSVVNRMYSRSQYICFYCDGEFTEGRGDRLSKTTDHLIPTVMLKAYGYEYLDDDEVPCCYECNQDKASLHPVTWRVKVIRNFEMTGDNKWKIALKTLNKILTDKKDPFNE